MFSSIKNLYHTRTNIVNVLKAGETICNADYLGSVNILDNDG